MTSSFLLNSRGSRCIAGLIGGRLAQNVPLNIGAQLLAPYSAACQALDVRAMLRRHAPTRIAPLTDGSFRYPQRRSEGNLRSEQPRGSLQGVLIA